MGSAHTARFTSTVLLASAQTCAGQLVHTSHNASASHRSQRADPAPSANCKRRVSNTIDIRKQRRKKGGQSSERAGHDDNAIKRKLSAAADDTNGYPQPMNLGSMPSNRMSNLPGLSIGCLAVRHGIGAIGRATRPHAMQDHSTPQQNKFAPWPTVRGPLTAIALATSILCAAPSAPAQSPAVPNADLATQLQQRFEAQEAAVAS